MPVDYNELLRVGGGGSSMVGLDPGTIANFASQEGNAAARRSAVLRAIAGKKQDTMVGMEIGGKRYKVPAQHVSGIMQAQSLEAERARKSGVAETERARVAGTLGPKGRTISEQAAEQGILESKARTKKLGEPTVATPRISTQEEKERLAIAQRKEKREVRKATAERTANILTADFDEAKVLAGIENDLPEGSILYAVDTIRKNEILPIRIPPDRTFNNLPVDKQLIMSQWRAYNEANNPVELQEFYDKFKNYFK